MQLSGEEFRKVSQVDSDDDKIPSGFGSLATAPARRGGLASFWGDVEDREVVRQVVDAVSQQPDVREQIVASLRERIESGDYNVSGEQIAEMMLRRALTDRAR
jgi:negative regulator of flagellin synthesis FlgM